MADKDTEDKDKKEAPEGEEKEDGGEGETEEEKKKSPLILILAITVPVLLIIGICVFLFLTPPGKRLIGLEEEKKEEKVAEETKPQPKEIQTFVYFDLPDILVNVMNPKSRRPIFLKLSIYLEIFSVEDKREVEKVKPRIIDQFQVYLRGLRLEDLQGSSGIQRLRAELLHRVQEIVGPSRVNDVLFKEMLIQ